MIASLTCCALAFSAPSSTGLSRRDLLASGIGCAPFIASIPSPAFAEMYGEGKAPKVGQVESIARAKQIKYAKPGVESEAFKAAEAKRLALQSGSTPKKIDNVQDDLARLGLKPYN